ncbi:Peroxisomal carnitine O-octanoyltransferase [Holothuria leucospilota]|uniref:Peroxisomal carnitine O-octanoyltransferase n=1 Tax=Holothuria leucospilota TaxID=206669 RepID=A0A9Q1BH73_HOLLE|nr:Peroxisomal carnitine O-octanoyltransferase [Holothuria leucospilota]
MNLQQSIPGERTFQYEDSLPSLPLPPLQQTLHKYLESVKPFTTSEEFSETEQIVREFEQGVGKELHEKLEEKAKNSKNWLEEWWEDLAYLQGRSPIAVVGCMVGSAPSSQHLWAPRDGTQLERTSKSAWLTGKYFQMLRTEALPVARSGREGRVVSMSQYRSIFSTSRIPGEPKDKMAYFFKTASEGPCPNHMVVFSNGHIFKLEVFDKNENLFGSYEILRQLSNIKERSSFSRGQSVGVLTADDRTSWAKLFMTAMAGKNVEDRWFDKSFNTIYFANGVIGFVGDHCPYEGIIGTIFNTWADDVLARTTTDWLGNPDIRDDGTLPEELVFVIDEQIQHARIHAKDTYTKLASKCDVYCSRFPLYGRVWVKENGFHPDAFMQLAIQLAYHTKYGKPGPCYETATTRQFYRGRTATVRSCTSEVVEWCKAMNSSHSTKDEKIELMKGAAAAHMVLGSQALEGQGCDRHLLGLYAASLENDIPTPEIFTDPSFFKSGGGGNFVLSTSLLGYWEGYGEVAPMREDGYGIFYNLCKEEFYVIISSFKTCPETDSHNFFVEIFKALVRMQNLINGGPKL